MKKRWAFASLFGLSFALLSGLAMADGFADPNTRTSCAWVIAIGASLAVAASYLVAPLHVGVLVGAVIGDVSLLLALGLLWLANVALQLRIAPPETWFAFALFGGGFMGAVSWALARLCVPCNE